MAGLSWRSPQLFTRHYKIQTNWASVHRNSIAISSKQYYSPSSLATFNSVRHSLRFLCSLPRRQANFFSSFPPLVDRLETMTIKIYGFPASTCTGRVLATLFEKDVTDFELVPVNLQTGEHKKPEFLKLQPFGVIPVLQDGPLTIFESRAIARTVAHKYEGQGTPLYGKTPIDKALVETWLEVEGQNYNPAITPLVVELVFKPMRGGQPDQAVVDASIAKLDKVLDVYEEHLSKSKYLAGDFFSLADLSHLPYTTYLIKLAKRGDFIEKRPHVKAWWDDISSRPAWKKVGELAAASH